MNDNSDKGARRSVFWLVVVIVFIAFVMVV